MSNSNRIVINSTSARRTAPVIIIPDADTSAMSMPLAAQKMAAMGALGGGIHEVFGVGMAIVLVLLVLPVLVGALTLAHSSRGDGSETALRDTLSAALLAPVLAFPGACLGLWGAPVWLMVTALARVLQRKMQVVSVRACH